MRDNFILADTSAWILSFKKTGFSELKKIMHNALEEDKLIITPFITIELLQECNSKKEYSELKDNLSCLKYCNLSDDKLDKLYSFSFSLRRKGLTIPTIDVILAFLSIENGYILLHHDKHFRMIAEKSALKTLDYLT